MRTAALVGVILCAGACAARQSAEPQTGSASPLPPEAARATASAAGGAGVAAINSGIFRQAAGATAAPADLPLGPGDLLEISVVDMPEMSGRRVRIPRQGTVNLPLLGEVMVAGRTSAEVEEDLRKRLQEKYMHDPQVAVFVHERRSQRVSVLGAVKKGGVFELSGRMRLADALAMAEGLTDDADQVIFLFRRAPSDVVARAAAQGGARAQAASAQNAPATGQQQSAPAEGARPGELTDVMTTVDLEAIAAGNEELNVPLEAGDVIQVPRAGSVYVGGSVVKPGPVQLRGRTTVHQAIVAAGGPTNVAAWGDVRLYRKKPDGQVEIKTFDLDEFEAGKEVPVVQKNDVVVVGKSAIKAFFYGSLDLLRGVFGVGVGL